MDEGFNGAGDEPANLEQRVRTLAAEKSYLQLPIHMMGRLGAVTGLDDTIENMLRVILDTIGGSNLIIYYRIDDAIHYQDVYGRKERLSSFEDLQVKTVFEIGEPVEYQHDFSDTRMLTPEFTKASTWVFPLRVGREIVGVVKMEGLHMGTGELRRHLPTFFSYTALILKNEILGFTRLKEVCDRLSAANRELESEIAERKRAEEELEKARDAAEAANRAKSVFLANMSHELRTPLNAILGFTHIMNHDDTLPEPARRNLSIVNRCGEHLLSMINEVLDLSKIEAGKVELREELLDLPALMAEICDMFRARAGSKGLDLILVLVPGLARCVRADMGKLRQVLINLLGNAVKFTETGMVTLRCLTRPMADDPFRLLLEAVVEDTGPGIRRDRLSEIFESFSQAGSDKVMREGTGLGLTISRSYARLMGGDIVVESEEGVGAMFRLTLPVGVVADQSLAAASDQGITCAGMEPGGSEWRVLIVDDDTENIRLLESMLTRVGFKVRTSRNGGEGIETARLWRPHFIWLDMGMPVMDGIAAARRIREFPWGKDVAIHALSAGLFAGQEGDVIAAGCDGVLLKPYREEEVFRIMGRRLGIRFRYAGIGSGVSSVFAAPALAIPSTGELAALSAEVARRIGAAAAELNKREILDACREMEKRHPSVAAFCKARAISYDFEAIERLMKAEKE